MKNCLMDWKLILLQTLLMRDFRGWLWVVALGAYRCFNKMSHRGCVHGCCIQLSFCFQSLVQSSYALYMVSTVKIHHFCPSATQSTRLPRSKSTWANAEMRWSFHLLLENMNIQWEGRKGRKSIKTFKYCLQTRRRLSGKQGVQMLSNICL